LGLSTTFFSFKVGVVKDAHVTIALNLASGLRNHVRGSGCRVFMADMKLRIEALNLFYYPDMLVSCDRVDRNSSTFKSYPCLIVEVLSNSTEAFDRGDYRLQECGEMV